MKVKDLRKWLEFYDDNLEFVMKYGDAIISPNILTRAGEMLIFSKEYDLLETDVAIINTANIILGGKEIKDDEVPPCTQLTNTRN